MNNKSQFACKEFQFSFKGTRSCRTAGSKELNTWILK